MRILVVEDEADLNLLLCKVLTKAGYTVDGCLDGEDAQAHLLGAAYDGILLDVMLPKKDGYTLVRELRDQGNDTPVLFLTPGTVWPTGSRGWTWAGTTIWSNPLTLPSCWPVSGP